MEIIDGPRVVAAPLRHCVGIRVVTPFRGMFAVRDQLMTELYSWAAERAVAYGHTFFRLHVVDMDGPMDVEDGMLRDWAHDQGLTLDRTVSPAGERFACRYEAYLTDPRTEPRKTRWHTELAIRLTDESPEASSID
ncbi:hypothetical protein [Winogradskya consettensis]|uniref:hypothetical protein n=1 Tax=Winogradskya consettensis TaxID=113560 RepID=UPI001BB30441|nr:hypothetical protein [Actinoplanes consettensis]